MVAERFCFGDCPRRPPTRLRTWARLLMSRCSLGSSNRWQGFVLLVLFGLFPPKIALAQATCTTDCTGACEGFQSAACSIPNGCTGFTVCTIATGLTSCHTFGTKVPCTQCGAGGFRVCSALGTIGPCRPERPQAESCNSCDDDANGQVDDGIGGTCMFPNGCSGTTSCVNGTARCTLAPDSTRACAECANGTMACHSDGTFGPCQPAIARDETCNLCDDDKDGIADEVGPSFCTMPGGCQGLSRCVNGTTRCEEYEGSKKYGCAACGEGGFQRCLPNGGLSACRRASPTAEKCDGCDDDGDGLIDNQPNGGAYSLVGVCQGPQGPCLGSSSRCTPQGWSECSAGMEICDGVDNDCDGVVDNGGVCRHEDITCRCRPRTCADISYLGSNLPDGCGGFITCR
jgi:hypothetical protein